MPVISVFYGLIISLYYFDNKQHKLPHVHVRYSEMEGVFAIESGDLLEGKLPKGKIKLVEAWIEIHREDLMANWQLAISGQRVFPIDPLK
ncbi:type II toxin-antitoxin system toxin DhiT [Spirosoma fluminis]